MEPLYHLQNINSINKFTKESEIQKYFQGLTIFITGATGFLGSLLVEKLLRSCPDIKTIYILMRSKKGHCSDNRFLQYFQKPIFELLQNENPEVFHKVKLLLGNCELPNLGLSNESMQIITSEVNCIMHLAATVRFDEKLRAAAHINIRSVLHLLQIAKEVENLSSMVFVSTAFSNCPSNYIDEVFYKPHISGLQLLSVIDQLSDEVLDKITPSLLFDKWPNTYVFTKIIAEDIVKTESGNVPIAIIRPSIIVATANQPIAGWIDNMYGPTGVIAGSIMGLIRSVHCKHNKVADLIPADYVTNNIIATAWSAAKNSNKGTIPRNIPIYNCVSGSQNPITWGKVFNTIHHQRKAMVSVMELWYPFVLLVPYEFLQIIFHCVLHIIPAYFIDALTLFTGKRTNIKRTYQKINKYLNEISYFATHQWCFENKNTQELWNELNTTDQEIFNFNVKNLQWESYFYYFIKGIRLYLIKDPLETLPEAQRKYKIHKYLHYFVVATFWLTFLYITFKFTV